jgi:glycosyltransferase involved in cell wall biosynthesis
MPKLLYFTGEDWAVVSHFLPMIRTAVAAGFEVVVATKVGGHKARIEAEGCRVVSLEHQRASLAGLDTFRDFRRIQAILRAERPDVVHCISVRLVVLGGIAARLEGVRWLVLAPIGLGSLWMENSLPVRVARSIARTVIGSWLKGPRTRYIFENADDPAEFGLEAHKPPVTIVPGAGVDPKDFPASLEPPAPPLKVAVVARMLKTKGIVEAVEAVRRARALGAPVELSLYGSPDPGSRLSCTEEELGRWSAEPGITWHGATDDIAAVWRTHHVAMLLTYREGMPRALIEAAASGRPIVATDVQGCRDLVRDGQEGMLVPAHNPQAAARALVKLAGDPDLRARLGAAALARFQERFTEAEVRRAVASVYAGMAV